MGEGTPDLELLHLMPSFCSAHRDHPALLETRSVGAISPAAPPARSSHHSNSRRSWGTFASRRASWGVGQSPSWLLTGAPDASLRITDGHLLAWGQRGARGQSWLPRPPSTPCSPTWHGQGCSGSPMLWHHFPVECFTLSCKPLGHLKRLSLGHASFLELLKVVQ